MFTKCNVNEKSKSFSFLYLYIYFCFLQSGDYLSIEVHQIVWRKNKYIEAQLKCHEIIVQTEKKKQNSWQIFVRHFHRIGYGSCSHERYTKYIGKIHRFNQKSKIIFVLLLPMCVSRMRVQMALSMHVYMRACVCVNIGTILLLFLNLFSASLYINWIA